MGSWWFQSWEGDLGAIFGCAIDLQAPGFIACSSQHLFHLGRFFGTLHLGLWLGVPIDANPGLICHHVSMQTLEHNRPVGFLVLVINRTPPKQCDDRVLDDVLGESS